MQQEDMIMIERAAQFSPFAALSGYDAAVQETERLTTQRRDIDEDEKQKISERLTLLHSCLPDAPNVEITYFVPDQKKDGGDYGTVTGIAKKLDEFQRIIILTDGTKIPIDEIININGAIFQYDDDSPA